jgi:hypothetical protein
LLKFNFNTRLIIKNLNFAPFGLWRKRLQGALQGAHAPNKNLYNMTYLQRCPNKFSTHSVLFNSKIIGVKVFYRLTGTESQNLDIWGEGGEGK